MSTGVPSGGGGVQHRNNPTLPPLPTHTHTFFKFVGILQNVSVKFPDPMLSVNLEYFIIKNEMQNSINIQSRKNQTFTSDNGY